MVPENVLTAQDINYDLSYSTELYYLDQTLTKIDLLIDADMSQSSVGLDVLLVSNDPSSTPSQSVKPGYLVITWDSTQITNSDIKIEYSEDGNDWLDWATVQTGGDEQGDIFFALPEIDDALLPYNLFFRVSYETSQNASGNLNIFYVYDTSYTIVAAQSLNAQSEFSFKLKEEKEWNIPLPDFNYDPSQDFKFDPEINEYVDEEGNLVYILNDACSIPCETAEVSVEFDGCCMLHPAASGGGGLAFSFLPAKAGTVTVNAPDESGCAKIIVTINGQETKSLFVEACEPVAIIVGVEPKDPSEGGQPECCNACAFVTAQPNQLIPECEGAVPLLKKIDKNTGKSKTFLNKKKLINEIKKRRHNK
jgi:hypothetical protein